MIARIAADEALAESIKAFMEAAYASASGDAICCGGGRVRGVEQRTNIDRFG
jgi:hypothetical protein